MKINKNNYEAFLLDYVEGNLSAEDTAELMLFLQQNPDLETGLEDFKFIELNKEEAKFDSKNELKRKEFVVNDDLIEGLIVSYINGDLSKAEEKKLLETIKGNIAYEKLLKQYQMTKLERGDEKLSDKVLLKGHLPITSENAEYFIIAESENVLNKEEKKALADYKKSFPGVKEMALAYSSVKLDAKEKIVFENKSSLKRKEGVVISMWMRYVSVAAAACLILYFSFFTGTENNSQLTAYKVNVDSENTENNNLASKENVKDPSIRFATQDDDSIQLPQESDSKFYASQNNTKKNTNAVNGFTNSDHSKKDRMPKEPVLDNNYAQDDFKSQQPNNENYAMMEKAIIPEIENKDEYALANNVNKNISSLNEDDFITPGQYVRNWAKKTFFIEEAENKYSEEVTTMADNSTLRLKGTNTTIQNKEDKDYKEYGFSIGKFEFKRKVRK